VTCRFCGATSHLESGEGRPPVEARGPVYDRERFRERLADLGLAYAEGMARREPPSRAFREAAASALSEYCDPDVITNVVFGIAADFNRANGTDVARDPAVAPRLAAAYIDSLEPLSKQAEYEINLPFLTTTASGPLHFSQRVTIERLAELAATPAGSPEEAPTSAGAKPWWKRILG
jgi:hypothetical protein